MLERDKKQEAISLFESGCYRDAFLSFLELYQSSRDEEEREIIFQTLLEGYYQPNEAEMQALYCENCALLLEYPYQWGFQECPLEYLPVQLFPVSDTEYCLFHRQEKSFLEIHAFTSDQLQDYLFQDLSQPVFRENDCNLYHLQYLWDNVRRSEDFGGDNHIYLYYDTLEDILPLLLLGDLGPLLKDQKFVFLVGREHRKRYPVDFKKQFQIDYAAMGPQPVRVEEIKRIVYWYKHAHSGTSLSRAVLGSLDEIQMLSGHDFNAYSKVDGKRLYTSWEFKEDISCVDHCYTVDQISEMIQSGKYELHLAELEDYLTWLRQRHSASYPYTVKDLFCGYFLFHYEKRGRNPRIAPMLLYDPHVWDPSTYNDIIFSFPYYTVLTCVREPVMTFIRCQQVGIVGWEQVSTMFMLASDYVHAQFLHPDLLPCYYGFRFEDLKTKPEIVCRTLCKHLNVPFEPQMLEVEAPATNSGHDVRGFDHAPLHWDLNDSLSEFDRVRLNMFYEPIHRYYGYPTFSFAEHPVPENVVRELFKVPFRFEYTNPKIFGKKAPSWNDLHSWVQEVLQGAWRKKFVSPKLITLEEPLSGQSDS